MKTEDSIIKNLSLVSIIGNTLLSLFKFIAGIIGHSSAMLSDAVHSFSDVLTTIIAWFGVKLAQKQPDRDHPYGHERLECVASLFLGLLLAVTGLGVGKVGLDKIIARNYSSITIPGTIALIAAIVSIITKEAMFWYTRYYAKQINSSAFMADAWHHRSDAFSSIGSVIGIGGAMLGYPVMDSIASVVICVFILKVSYDILKDAISKMLDTSCDEAYEQKLKDFISNEKDVENIDMLHTRMFGNKVYIDLEIQVDGNLPLKTAHTIADKVHDDVENAFPEIKHIMIHVNPTC
ncbi:MAG: cation transporter [Sphaerochaetaceae bacterium]|nr:cation transporter [Sphaerochaetaceae bacterium]